ncbi:molybdopterin biosynthesis protein MoeB [Idiomarina piscisalsi]|uniref:Molybdopterin biosynthesis protein MoeB n=1 Tax=Idiomarina piscisalsi TaxID=1096243 RepID=A0ABN5AX60_9GAMM|nr:HesA/MoeB/ThiF family protein [Idiomarina piscisalsi]ASG65950.1 molybdopterin biosynthesis protein MoeB [Idiomarina piscisalsi]
MLTDQQALRYSSNLLIGSIGESGQQRLLDSQVLIIGLGGLGTPASQYLASSGVGQLTLMDHDKVSLSNLQRQMLYSGLDVGLPKVTQAAQRLADINPDVDITTLSQAASEDTLREHIGTCDIVLDCTDNRDTRYLINRYCYWFNKPLISGAARGFNGQVVALHPGHDHGCYQCLYPTEVKEPLDCSNAGIAAPVVGIIGAMQSLLAIQYLTQHELPWGLLQSFDGLGHQWHVAELPKSATCPICGGENANNR